MTASAELVFRFFTGLISKEEKAENQTTLTTEQNEPFVPKEQGK